MQLTPQQDSAAKAVSKWLSDKDKQVFRLFGYAGTGKTTITKMLVEEVEGNVCFAAYTGKAALVMQRNGMQATTLHSLAYHFAPPSQEKIKKLKEEYTTAQGMRRREIEHALNNEDKPQFTLNPESELKKAKLLVIDEVSMVNAELGIDVESFKVPILVIGDPGQLPPIEGAGYFVNAEPDVMLTDVMRQAKDNPIIDLATRVRTGQQLPFAKYGESEVLSKQGLTTEMVLGADQIITGMHKNRRAMNRQYRGLKNFTGTYPNLDERLICLKNARDHGLLNGLMGTVASEVEDLGQYLSFKILLEDAKLPTQQLVHKAHFDAYEYPQVLKEMSFWDWAPAREFDFGYVITCHKAQGSQWEDVLINDDGFGFNDYKLRIRWLYTAITRAVERVTLIK